MAFVTAMPIISGGEVLGLLVGDVAFDRVAAELVSLRYGAAGYAQLVSADGVILADANGRGGTDMVPTLARAMRRDDGARHGTYEHQDGTRWVASWAVMQEPRWRVIVMQPEAQALAKVATVTSLTAALLGGSLVTLLVLGLFAVGSVTRPLERVASVAGHIADEHFEARVPPSAIAELALLGDAFNAMADRLAGLLAEVRRQNRELEARVAHRTAELARARDEAEAANRAKGQFLAAMSHEIRSPLGGVIGMTEILLETDLTAGQRDFAATILSASQALLSIIDEILDFSKIEAGKLELERTPFDPRPLIEDVAVVFGRRAQDKGVELLVDIDPDVSCTLAGDPHRLRQVLTNLVSNAVKFTESGEVEISARIEQMAADRVLLALTVRDTGIGIAPEARARLFESFTQGDASTTRRFGGTGLGLAISAQLVERMGGEIGLDSAPGRGSRFSVTVAFDLVRAAASEGSGAAAELAGKRALAIDDNAASRALLDGLLARWGIRCDAVADAPSGLARARSEAAAGTPYDTVLLDLDLAGGAAGRDHEAELGAQTELLLLMAPQAEYEAAARRADNRRDVIAKPIRANELLRRIRRHLSPSWSEPRPDPVTARHAPNLLAGVRVLVVDDNAINRKVTVAVLGGLGCEADTARNGAEAIASLEKGTYDLVLMDCHMPEIDGYEATRIIRRNEQAGGPRLPIVGLSAQALPEHRQQALAAGMDDYLVKPVVKQTLRRALVAVLEGHEALSVPPRRAGDPDGADDNLTLDARALEDLREMSIDGNALVAETATDLLERWAADLQQLDEALAANDAARLETVAHSLKSATAHLGATAASQLCAHLEQLAAGGELDRAPSNLGELHALTPRLRRALAELVKNGGHGVA
jgi:signal transduction histidine kinase/CheY-like chemotaxis protein